MSREKSQYDKRDSFLSLTFFFLVALEMEPRVLHRLGKHSITDPHPKPTEEILQVNEVRRTLRVSKLRIQYPDMSKSNLNQEVSTLTLLEQKKKKNLCLCFSYPWHENQD